MNIKNQWLLKVRPAFVASFFKKILLVKRQVYQTEYGNFFIDPLSNFGQSILIDGVYESELTQVLGELLSVGDSFLDVGANEGYFSVVASKLVGDGRVVAVEPQSRLQNVIFRNIELNHAHNIEVFQKALSDEVGVAELSLAADMNTGASGLINSAKYKCPTEIIPQTTLDEFLKSLSLIDIKLMKMDIESFEYEVILGSKKIFQDGIIKNIALELHPSILKKRGKSEIEILNFLMECGYSKNTKFKTLVLSKIN